MKFFLVFILCGLVGFVIDTTYRSLRERRYTRGTWLPFFSPTYAGGGLILYLLFSTWPAPGVVQIIGGTLLCTLWELSAGVVGILVLKRRFWDYSNNPLNYRGYIDAKHTVYWFILTTAYYTVLRVYF